MHDDLKRRLHDEVDAELGTRPPSDLSEVLRRGRGKRLGIRLVATASVVVLGVLGGFAVRSAVSNDAAPIPPADEKKQEIDSMRNGRILHAWAGDTYWEGSTAPPAPTGSKVYHWDAFDPDTGSFLYAAERYWVIGEDGLAAEFQCPVSSGCGGSTCCLGGIESFGPDPDEITVPSQDSRDSESAHVIGFDGTLRDTLDISAATAPPHQMLSDLEWSPDGNLLAVSTEQYGSCDRSRGQCGGRVWIFDRAGGEPELVYSESERMYTALRDLAWSPDGNRLAALVAPGAPCGFPVQAPPRVAILRVAPDEPVRAETPIVYEDDGSREGCILPHHLRLSFPFAWSPDGTRIAVIWGQEITEISVENGEVLARNEAVGAEGPLAWLPKR